jgi:hypothetical protein
MNEKQQYEFICKKEFQEIKEMLQVMNTALFIGNGKPSLKAQAEINYRAIRAIVTVGGMLLSAIIVCVVELWFKK